MIGPPAEGVPLEAILAEVLQPQVLDRVAKGLPLPLYAIGTLITAECYRSGFGSCILQVAGWPELYFDTQVYVLANEAAQLLRPYFDRMWSTDSLGYTGHPYDQPPEHFGWKSRTLVIYIRGGMRIVT